MDFQRTSWNDKTFSGIYELSLFDILRQSLKLLALE